MQKQKLLFIVLSSILAFSACRKAAISSATPNFDHRGINQMILDTDKAMDDEVNITPYLEVCTGEVETPGFNDTSTPRHTPWKKCDPDVYAGAFSHEGYSWFRLTVQNNTPVPFTKLLCFNDFDQVDFDYFSQKIERGGEDVPIRNWSYPGASHCVKFLIGGHQTKTFYIRCYKQGPGVNRPVNFILRSEINEKVIQAYEIRSRMTDIVFLFFYLGFLTFCFFYFLVQYFYRLHDKILLVYALYILFTFLYSFRDVDKHYFLKTALPWFDGLYKWSQGIFSYLSYIFYSLFVIQLLEIKKNKPKAYRLIAGIVCIIALLLIIDIVLRLSGQQVAAFGLFRTGRMLLFPFIILYFILMMPFSGGYYRYFLWGTIFLVSGTGLNLLVHLIRNDASLPFHEAITSRYGFWGNTVNYTRIGVIAEVLFFSLGLAKKLQVDFATTALREQSAIENRFYTHEIKSALTTLHDKLDNTVEAERYATLFKHFLQKVLQLMKKPDGIALTREIEIAREYFVLRKDDGEQAELSFINDAAINTDHIYIPAGLLIPFIQNFFDHAVTGTAEKNFLTLTLYKEGNKIVLKIADNGGGIENMDVLNNPASSGLDIARRKINLFNTARGTRMQLKIDDNKSGHGMSITIINLPEN